MVVSQELKPRIVTLKRPQHHYVSLVAADGSMLGLDDDGRPALFDEADDRVIWDRTTEGVHHVATGRHLAVDTANDTCNVTVGSDEVSLRFGHGPEKLPSEYLEHLRREGWACLNSILPEQIVERLERVACTGPYEQCEQNNDMPKICQDAAVGMAVAEPVSLWVLRAYLQTRDIHLGHPPGFNVLPPETLAQAGRRWHSDIPYTPSSSPQPVFARMGPPKACNRNTFVSDFSHLNGATMFTPGSHLVDSGPPDEWNAALENGELPYSGPEATVLEAPSGEHDPLRRENLAPGRLQSERPQAGHDGDELRHAGRGAQAGYQARRQTPAPGAGLPGAEREGTARRDGPADEGAGYRGEPVGSGATARGQLGIAPQVNVSRYSLDPHSLEPPSEMQSNPGRRGPAKR